MTLFDSYDPTAYGAQCHLCPLAGAKVVPPKLATATGRATLVIIGESPGTDESIRGEPLKGRAGAVLEAVCSEHDIPLSSVHKTNAILCKLKNPGDTEQTRQALACCRPRLLSELQELRGEAAQLPATLLGRWALEAVSGKANITNWLGSPNQGAKFNSKGKVTKSVNAPIDFSFVKYIATFHPSFGLREPAYMPVIETHIVWGSEMALGTLPEWKWPEAAFDDTEARIAALEAILAKGGYVACDVETAGLSIFDDLLDIGFANADHMVSVPWYQIDHNGIQAKLVRQILESGKCRLVFQNGQFDTSVLAVNGFSLDKMLAAWDFDTLIGHHVAAPKLPHKLDFIACVEFPLQRWKQEFRASSEAGSNRYIAADPLERAEYNARDCYVTYRLVEALQSRVDEVHNGQYLFDRYMKLTKVAAEMRYDGFPILVERFKYHRKELTIRKLMAEKAISRLLRPIGVYDFNPGNARHVRTVFTKTLGVKSGIISRKTGEPSYNAKALLEIATSSQGSTAALLAREILTYRRWAKLLDTYIDGIPVVDNKVHATWNVFGTRTGRWSSQDPSLQVIPKPKIDRAGKIIAPGLRDIFGCRKVTNWLLEIDYSQLEARILALLAPDRTLLQWYREGRDVHKLTAASLFGKTEADVNDKERDLAKRARYGIAYMGTAKTIWRSLVVDYPSLLMSDVERLIKAFFKLHPDILGWQQRVVYEARTKGFVEAPLSGRRFRFHGGQVEPTKCIVAIQMTAADLMDGSVIGVKTKLDRSKGQRILAQVHDSMVLETGSDWKSVARMAKQIMEREIELGGVSTSFPVDIKVGKDWGNARKVKAEEL